MLFVTPAVLLCLAVAAPAGAAVIGTYAETSVMVADGTTVYTAWVFVDNTGPPSETTWGSQHSFFLPPSATLIPGGLGVAYGRPDASRDFYSGNPMVLEVVSGPNVQTGLLVNPAQMVMDNVGDVQFYKFTVNPNAPLGPGNFDLGPGTALTGSDGQPQAFTKKNVMFSVTGLEGDLTFDGFVGLDDLDLVLNNWNEDTGVFDPPPGDSNGDGFVGLDDLDWVLNNWNAGTPPAAVAVPEPGAIGLLLVGAGLFGARRRG